MDQATPAVSIRRLAVGLVVVALLAAIGVSGLGSAGAAETSGTPAPSYQPVQEAAPEATPPPDERRDGRDCPQGAGSSSGDSEQQPDGATTPSPTPDTDASV